MIVEKTKENHPVKFIYTVDLLGDETVAKLLGEEFSFFSKVSIISNEIDTEYEANIQMNYVLKQYQQNAQKVTAKSDYRNTMYYAAEGADNHDWEELVIREVSVASLEPEDDNSEKIAIGRLHIIPQLQSFEISKLMPTILH